MLKFKEFLSEEARENVKIDARYLEQNKNKMNAELDELTSHPYQNAPIFLAQLRGFFERYTMLLPASTTKNFIKLEAELVYALGDTGEFLYIVYDTNDDGFVDGYAQIVSADELSDLMDMDREDLLGSEREALQIRHSDWYRKRDDDAGNTNEY